MAMAYCSCGKIGNFMQCPDRFDREDDGTWTIHRVRFDEVHNDNNDGVDDTGEPASEDKQRVDE